LAAGSASPRCRPESAGIKIEGGIAARGQKDFADVYPNFDTEIASIAEAIPT